MLHSHKLNHRALSVEIGRVSQSQRKILWTLAFYPLFLKKIGMSRRRHKGCKFWRKLMAKPRLLVSERHVHLYVKTPKTIHRERWHRNSQRGFDSRRSSYMISNRDLGEPWVTNTFLLRPKLSKRYNCFGNKDPKRVTNVRESLLIGWPGRRKIWVIRGVKFAQKSITAAWTQVNKFIHSNRLSKRILKMKPR